MAGFLNTALPSSDEEEDDDYNPAVDNTAEREDRPQTAVPSRGGASNKRRRGAAIGPAAKPSGGNDDDDEDEEGEVGEAGEEGEEEEHNPRILAKRAKVSSLWEEINARAAAKGSATDRPPSSSVNLAALCRSSSGAAGKRAKPVDPDAIWMRSLGMLKRPSKPADASRQRQPQEAAASTARPATAAAAVAESGGSSGAGPSMEEKRAVAAAALAAVRDASAAGSRMGKVAVTEVRRFAGKDIQVTLHVDKDSKEAQKAAARASAPQQPPASSGLDALLAEVEKKKKVSVLDKTKADWNEYKAVNNEVDEELETFKKSGEQYLEKQNFLKRAELREYEKERDIRLNSDVRTRGRL